MIINEKSALFVNTYSMKLGQYDEQKMMAKFQKNMAEIVDFFVMVKFGPSREFSSSVSIFKTKTLQS